MASEAWRALRHDVGKYIARVARNVPTGAVPDALRLLLVQDLYAIDGVRRASAVFAARRRTLVGEEAHAPALGVAAEALARIDALEARVRAGDELALREAAAEALRVEEALCGPGAKP